MQAVQPHRLHVDFQRPASAWIVVTSPSTAFCEDNQVPPTCITYAPFYQSDVVLMDTLLACLLACMSKRMGDVILSGKMPCEQLQPLDVIRTSLSCRPKGTRKLCLIIGCVS
jgi:hypothetical protein